MDHHSDASFTQIEEEAMRAGFATHDTEQARLVIGIDYGTTFTGVAYATALGTQCTLDEIDVVTDWGPQMDNHDKVPSVISYHNGEHQWGSNLSSDAVAMVHTKLELGVQSVLGELDMTLQILDGMMDLNIRPILETTKDQDFPPYSHLSPEAIVTDYLTKVFLWFEQELERFGTVFRIETATDIVITVPTEWSYMAMNSTFRALSKAGFNHTKFPRLEEVMFITEPEAAALFTTRYYKDTQAQEFLKVGQYFILCDAGGGTVDVVSYQVQAVHPVLHLDQVGEPSGDKCGSIFINQEFKKWIREWIGDDEYRKLDPNLDIARDATHASETAPMRELMKRFDVLKKQFGVGDSRKLPLTLPEPIQNLNIPGKVDHGLIRITRQAMEKFFDACIGEIVRLIKDHIGRIGRRGSRPKNLFLVGGFGESEYLQYHIANMLEQERLNMQFRRPKDSWTAVVQGAVVCGIEKASLQNLRRANSCRHSYAVCFDEDYNKMYHAEADMTTINGRNVAEEQLKWILNKGDLILSDKPRRVERKFTLRLDRQRQDTYIIPIYRNLESEEGRPTRLSNARDEVETACELVIDLSKISFASNRRPGRILKPGTEIIYQATLTIVLELDWSTLSASVWWSGRLLTQSPVKYPPNH